jgi:predicted DCC family thiol-disulfide oxidoreductase YuxK
MREIRLLKRLDRDGNIWFTDIAGRDFDATEWGTTQRDLMARIRGRLPNGEWIEGVEVFRQLYGAVGLGRLAALTRIWGISHAADAAYTLFAKNRLRLTGRSGCDTGACAIPESAQAP